MANRLAVAVLLVAGVMVAAGPAPADEIYSYVDSNGVAHFTNVPGEERDYRVIGVTPTKAASNSSIPSQKLRTGRRVGLRVPHEYQPHIIEAARRYNIPAELIKAVMAVESGFQPTAVSAAGALGLMQLMPETAQLMQVQNPFDPRQSILGGARFLRYLADRLGGDLVLTVAAYNAGLQAVLDYGDIPPFRETRRYVKRVIALYDALLAESGRRQAGGR